ncbi:hypothetical protein OPQ81_005991 [Rhizoctonia solani]|nr:hypothetical protein OPQ81_005991 [Rhizoctonia solani]
MTQGVDGRYFIVSGDPYLNRLTGKWRNALRVRTIEQVLMIIGSSVAQHARHIHFPAVDMFTCRRPIPCPHTFVQSTPLG